MCQTLRHLPCVASLAPSNPVGIPREILRRDYRPPLREGAERTRLTWTAGRARLGPGSQQPGPRQSVFPQLCPLRGAGAACKGATASLWAPCAWPDLALTTSQRPRLQMPSLCGAGLMQQFGEHSLVHSRDCVGRRFDPGEQPGVWTLPTSPGGGGLPYLRDTWCNATHVQSLSVTLGGL